MISVLFIISLKRLLKFNDSSEYSAMIPDTLNNFLGSYW